MSVYSFSTAATGGYWTVSGTYNVASGDNSYAEVVVSGETTLRLRIWTTQAAAFKYSIDGGSETTSNVTTLTADTDYDITLPDTGTHTVKIRKIGTFLFFVTASAFTTVGGGTLTTPTGYGTKLFFGASPFTTYGAVDGGLAGSGANGYTNVYLASSGQGVRFGVVPSGGGSVTLRFWIGRSGKKYVLIRDGTTVVTTGTLGTGFNYEYLDVTGLDSAATHEYEFQGDEIGGDPSNAIWLVYVEVINGSLETVARTAKPLAVWYGDPFCAEFLLTNHRDSAMWLICRAMGWTMNLQGPAQQIHTYYRDHTSLIVATAGVVCVIAGTSDITAGVTLANFEASNGTMLDNIRTQIGGAGTKAIYQFEIPEQTTIGVDETTRANYNAKFALTAAARSGVTVITLPAGTINPTSGVDTANGQYWNASGSVKIANRFAAMLSTPTNPSPHRSLSTLGVG